MSETTNVKPLRRFHVLVVGGLSSDAKPTVTSEFEVHSDGCAHLKRRGAQGAHGWRVVARSPEAVVEAEVRDFTANEQDWFAEDFKVLGCCDNAPVAE